MILPVVGLLLLLGLFWFWASSLIGDDGEAPATPSTQAIILTPEVPTPSPTTETEIVPQETTETDGGDGGNGGSTTEPSPTPTEEEEAPSGGTFEIDDLVTTTDSARLRSSPAIEDDNIVTTLNADTELRIIGGPTEADDYTWWEVSNDETGEEGWIAETLIEPS